MRDPASLDHLGVLESHRLGDTTGPEERAAGAEHGRDEVQHDLVDQSFAQRLAADVAGGEGDITSGRGLAGLFHRGAHPVGDERERRLPGELPVGCSG